MYFDRAPIGILGTFRKDFIFMIADKLQKLDLNDAGEAADSSDGAKQIQRSNMNAVSELKGANMAHKARRTADWLDALKASYSMAEIMNHGRSKRGRLYWFSRRVLEFFGALICCLLFSPCPRLFICR